MDSVEIVLSFQFLWLRISLFQDDLQNWERVWLAKSFKYMKVLPYKIKAKKN